jgi:hypothetical protein
VYQFDRLRNSTWRHLQGVQCIAHSAVPQLEGKAAAALDAAAALSGQTPEATLIKWSIQRGVPVVVEDVTYIGCVDAFFSWKLDEEHAKVCTSLCEEGAWRHSPSCCKQARCVLQWSGSMYSVLAVFRRLRYNAEMECGLNGRQVGAAVARTCGACCRQWCETAL